MPIPEIDITDLPDAGVEDYKDHYALQRFVLGSWQDFYTEAQTLNGPVKVAVIEWDMSDSLAEYISPETPGNYLVMLSAFGTFTPGTLTPGGGSNVAIYHAGSVAQYGLPFVVDSYGYGAIAYPVSDPSTDVYDALGTDIAVEVTVAPGAYDSTMRITVLYVEKEPI